jgi:hypothetical protein
MANLNEVKLEAVKEDQEEQFVEINGGGKVYNFLNRVFNNKATHAASNIVEQYYGARY